MPHFAAFCERYIRHTKGRWARHPFVLEDWQREFWSEALEVDPTTGLRIYTEVGLGLPRKNGKSAQVSAAGLYFMCADGEAEPEVYVGASARHQAGIVLGQARRMAQQSPLLLRLGVHVGAHIIDYPRNGGIMRALAADGALQHGLNPSASLIDELHAHKSPDLYTALTTGGGAREQPVTIWISTAGGREGDILASLYASMSTGPGDLEDRGSLRIYRDRVNGVLIWWYGAPRDADVEDPAVWVGTNPASWLRDGDYLRREFGRLKSRGALLEWRTFHLNQFPGVAESWLPDGAWKACADELLQNGERAHPLRVDLPVGIGVHKAPHSDAAAVVVAQRQGDRVVTEQHRFTPEEATGRVSSEAIRVLLRDLRGRFPLAQDQDEKTRRPIHGPAVAFDRWGFSESAEALDQEGINMVDFPQTASTMGPASTIAFELITTGRLIHDGDPQAADQVANTVATLTERGMRVTTSKAPRQNHSVVALVMAVAMAMKDAPPPSVRRPRIAAGF